MGAYIDCSEIVFNDDDLATRVGEERDRFLMNCSIAEEEYFATLPFDAHEFLWNGKVIFSYIGDCGEDGDMCSNGGEALWLLHEGRCYQAVTYRSPVRWGEPARLISHELYRSFQSFYPMFREVKPEDYQHLL